MKQHILYAGQGWRKNLVKDDDGMSMNMDYSYLFEQMFGVSNVAKNVASGGNMVKMSDLSSSFRTVTVKSVGT